jgi:uncharacterized protein (TIGR00369 family)
MQQVSPNPDFERDVRAAFADQGMMATLGAELIRVDPARVIITAPIRPQTSQQHGYAHAGLSWTIGDSAAGFAAMSQMNKGDNVLTVEMKINLMQPARGERLEARGKVLRAGGRIFTVMSDVFAVSGDTRTCVAILLGTMMRLPASASARPALHIR